MLFLFLSHIPVVPDSGQRILNLEPHSSGPLQAPQHSVSLQVGPYGAPVGKALATRRSPVNHQVGAPLAAVQATWPHFAAADS